VKRVSALAGVDGCEGDDRIVCVDGCAHQAIAGFTTNTAHYFYQGLPRDGIAAGVVTDGCARSPALAATELLYFVAGRGVVPAITPGVTGSTSPLPYESWHLWDAAWYGIAAGILGATWSLDHGVFQVGIFSRVKWDDPTTRQATCFAQPSLIPGDSVPDCVPGVKVELSAPSSGIVYNRPDKGPNPLQPGDRTSIAGGALAANLPPGNHELRVHLPPGVRCSAFMDGTDRSLATAWPADAPDTYRLPIVAGMITTTAIFCDDDRQMAVDAGAPAADGG
jgi:hypothetical protein